MFVSCGAHICLSAIGGAPPRCCWQLVLRTPCHPPCPASSCFSPISPFSRPREGQVYQPLGWEHRIVWLDSLSWVMALVLGISKCTCRGRLLPAGGDTYPHSSDATRRLPMGRAFRALRVVGQPAKDLEAQLPAILKPCRAIAFGRKCPCLWS